MWLEIMGIVATALRAELPHVTVSTAVDAVVPDVDTVRVTRASSPARALFQQLSGAEALAVECWTRNDDPDLANAQLQAMENNVLAALRGIARIDPIMTVEILGLDPDGDLFRPAVGSRFTLNISWRKPRQSYI
jgi:hypothetical protein